MSTDFENKLIQKGYKRLAVKLVNGNYKLSISKTDYHSTMNNLSYLYTNDNKIIEKITKGEGITKKERFSFINFGLHEAGKPPTLITPRPKIEVVRFKNILNHKTKIIEDNNFDDSMNLVLIKESFEDIYKAMFDKNIIFKYDLTK